MPICSHVAASLPQPSRPAPRAHPDTPTAMSLQLPDLRKGLYIRLLRLKRPVFVFIRAIGVRLRTLPRIHMGLQTAWTPGLPRLKTLPTFLAKATTKAAARDTVINDKAIRLHCCSISLQNQLPHGRLAVPKRSSETPRTSKDTRCAQLCTSRS